MKYRKKSFAEKMVNYLLDGLVFVFGFILLIAIYTGIQTKVLGNDYNNFFGYSMFEVQTGSMVDTINPGDWVIVKITPNIKLNDIITYKLGSEYITHRVVEVYSGTYITKGDANSVKDDKPVDQKQVVGKVVKVLSGFGFIRKTILNVSVLIAILITLLLFNVVFKKNKYEKARKNSGDITYYLSKEIVDKVGTFWGNIRDFIRTKILKRSYMDELEDNIRATFDRKYDFSKLKNEEVIEDELGKTAIYRMVSVDAEEVDDKYKEEEIIVEKETEDELEKTAFFRMVSVDAEEIENKQADEDKLMKTASSLDLEEDNSDFESIADEELLEEELGKTSVFRVISVDANEVGNTLLEIAKNEMKEAEQNDKDKKEEEIVIETEDDEEDDSLTKINLELLKGKKSSNKDNNVIDTAMAIKKEELNDLVDILLSSNKNYINKVSVKNLFIKTYINARYYNLSDNKISGRNLISKIKRAIKDLMDQLIKDYKGSDSKYNEIVKMYGQSFTLIVNLEQGRDSISDLKVKREFYKKEIVKCFKDWEEGKVLYAVNEIIKIQKKYADTLNYFFEKFKTNMFELNINKVSNIKDMYAVELNHNVSFSKVYSDYIIDKTYNEGIIAEDKIVVLLTLLSNELIEDMISSDFNKKYVVYIPATLYKKERKLNKILKMVDDEYAKNNIIILLTYEDLLDNKQVIKSIRRQGYKFALAFSKDTVIKRKTISDLYIVDYIFVNKKDENMEKILSFIPEELSSNIIYEDIIEKVGDLGSE